MAADEKMILRRLGDDELVFPLGEAEFVPLVAEHLAVAGTEADGFEAMHAAVVQEVPNDEAVTPELDAHIAAADFEDGAVRAQEIVPLGHDIEAFNQSADQQRGAIDGTVSSLPAGLTAEQLGKNGGCPPGSFYNPLWKIMGQKYPCTVKGGKSVPPVG